MRAKTNKTARCKISKKQSRTGNRPLSRQLEKLEPRTMLNADSYPTLRTITPQDSQLAEAFVISENRMVIEPNNIGTHSVIAEHLNADRQTTVTATVGSIETDSGSSDTTTAVVNGTPGWGGIDFNYSPIEDAADLLLAGQASRRSGFVRLNNNTQNAFGSAYAHRLYNSAVSFVTSFDFRCGPERTASGADVVDFVMHEGEKVLVRPSTISGSPFPGYALRIRVDTWRNWERPISVEPNNWHLEVGIKIGTEKFEQIALVNLPGAKDTNWHQLEIVYDKQNTTLEICMDGKSLTSIKSDIVNELFSGLADAGSNMGLFGYTGAVSETHDVRDWKFSSRETLTVSENQPAGTVVWHPKPHDDDGDSLTYTLVNGDGGADNASFEIINGELSTTESFDYETKATYSLRMRATDPDGAYAEKPFTVHVTDENDAPADVAISSDTIAENVAVGTTVGVLSTTDQDAGDTFTYTLVSGTGDTDNAVFEVVGNELRTKAAIDFESQSSYFVRVQTTDADGLFTQKALTLTVADINEAPTAPQAVRLSLSPNGGYVRLVQRNLALPAKTTFHFTAKLRGNVSFQWSDSMPELWSGNSVIHSSNRQTTFKDGWTTYTATITTDKASSYDLKLALYTVTVDIAEVSLKSEAGQELVVDGRFAGAMTNWDFESTAGGGSAKPLGSIFLNPATVTLPEGPALEADQFLSEILILDDALGHNTIELSGTHKDLFKLIDNRLYLRAGTLLDYEETSSLPLKVSVYDAEISATPLLTDDFTLTVTDVNDAPTDIALGPTTVDENRPVGVTVGTLTTNDQDAHESFSYSLAAGSGDTDNAFFTVSGDTVKTAATFDFEAKRDYTIRVRSTDAAGSWTEKAFAVTVADVNESPSAVTLTSIKRTVEENASTAARLKIADITVTDDGIGTNELTLSGADAESFEIDGAELFLKAGVNLDHESQSSYNITVTASDRTVAGEATVDFTLTVEDLNESPTAVGITASSVNESSDVGTVIGTLSATDVDFDDTHTFTLVSGSGDSDNAMFAIHGDELISAAVYDYETQASYSIRVCATDAGGLTTEQTYTISVNDIVEQLRLAPSHLNENAPLGTRVGSLTRADAFAGFTDLTIVYDATTGGMVLRNTTATSIDIAAVGVESPVAQALSQDEAIFPVDAAQITSNYSSLGSWGHIYTEMYFGNFTEVALTLGPNESWNYGTVAQRNLSSDALEEAFWLDGLFFGGEDRFGEFYYSDVADPGNTKYGTIAYGNPDVSYELIAGVGDSDNEKFHINGDTLVTNAEIDYESQQTYQIRIRSAVNGITIEEVVTITAIDANEAPESVNLINALSSVSEGTDATNRIKVADISIQDDALGTNTISLSGPDAGSFEVDGSELFLAAGVALDHETKTDYDVTVEAYDAALVGSPAATAAFTLTVSDINESPRSISLTNVITSLPESADTTAARKIADIHIVDDALGENDITLSGADADFFEVIDTTLFLKAGTSLSYGTKRFFDVSVEVTDKTAKDVATPTDLHSLYDPATGSLKLSNQSDGSLSIYSFRLVSPNRVLDGEEAMLPAADLPTTNHDLFGEFGKYSEVFFQNTSTTPVLTLAPNEAWNFGSITRSHLSNQDLFAAFGSDTDNSLPPQGMFLYEVVENDQVALRSGAICVQLMASLTLSIENDPEFSGTEYIDLIGGETRVDTKQRTGDYEILIRGDGTLVLEGENAHTRGIIVQSGTLIVTNAQAFGSGGLTIGESGVTRLDIMHAKPALASLTLAPTATLDVGYGGFTLPPDSISLDTLRGWISSGSNRYAWNGHGIISSSLVDYVNQPDNVRNRTDFAIGYYQRNAASPLIVGWAAAGDIDLNGVVQPRDVSAVIRNFGRPNLHWFQGDFVLYDGVFNAREISTLRNNWGSVYYNQKPTDISLTGSIASLPESADTSARIKVASIALEDDGIGKNTVTLSGDHADSFEVNGDGLYFFPSEGLNYESLNAYSVTITVNDSTAVNNSPTDPTLSVDFTLKITDVNDTPTGLQLSSTEIDENMLAGSVVGFFITNDEDAADVFSYALVAGEGDSNNADFKIVGDELQTRAPLDFEAKASYTVRVKATDAGGLATQKAFIISVNDVNEPPTSLGLSQTSAAIAENTDTATRIEIAEISITDDAKGTNAISLSGDDAAIFEIVANKLYLRAGTVLNYEARSPAAYFVTVEAIDFTVAGSTAVKESFRLSVTDINEPPSDISLSATAINENAPRATVVGTLSGIDPDTSETFSFALTSGDGDTDNAQFAIVGDELRTEAVFDYETKDAYAIRIKVTDSAGQSIEKALTIGVHDLNEAPSGLSFSNATTSLLENDAGARVITDSFDSLDTSLWNLWPGASVDAVVENGELRMHYASGTAGQWNVSEINSQNKLTLTGDFDISFDFDSSRNSTANKNNWWLQNIALRTDYGAGADFVELGHVFANGTVRYQTNYFDGTAHTNEWNIEVTQRRTGRMRLKRVGENIYSYYDDGTGWNYGGDANGRLVSGSSQLGSKDVFIVLYSGTFLGSNGIDSRYDNLVVRLPDAQSPDTRTAIKVAGVDVVDDLTGSNVLSLSGPDAAFFELADTALYLKAGTPLNHEVKSSYTVTVEVVDTTATDTTPRAADFTLTVTNAEEYPFEISLSSDTITDGSVAGTVVGALTTADGDAAESFTYHLVAGEGDTDNASFVIEDGILKTVVKSNFQLQASYTVRIRSTDSAGLSSERIFTVSVLTVTGFAFGFKHINESGAEQYLIETTGMKKYSEWQSPPITYWGPAANNAEGRLVYKFPVASTAQRIFMHAHSPSWDFFTEPGGIGRGASALEVSKDGINWVSLRSSLDPRRWGLDWTFKDYLPSEAIGGSELWVRMRFYTESVTSSRYTVTQFGRSTAAASQNVFEIRVDVATAVGGSGSGGSLLSAGSGYSSGSGTSNTDTTQSTPPQDLNSNTEQTLSADIMFAASIGDLSTTAKTKKSDDGDPFQPRRLAID